MTALNIEPSPGQRLLPVELDRIARNDPDRVLFLVPRNNTPSQGYEKVTAASLSNAVNRLCWWLDAKLKDNDKSKAIAYIGPNDLRYFMVILASVKTGRKVLLSSPRNSTEGHKSLAEQCNCAHWFISPGVEVVNFIRDAPHSELPALADLLSPTTVPSYTYEKTFEEGRRDLLMYLHTSGSSGLPKPVPFYLGTAATVDAHNLMEPMNGVKTHAVEWTGTRMLCAMPLFHGAGILIAFLTTVFFRYTVILPSLGPLMQHVVEEALDNIALDSAFVSPSVLQDMSESPVMMKKLAKLKFLVSAGGAISKSAGDIIHPIVPIIPIYGSTETGWVASTATHPSEWEYYHFHPRARFHFKPYSETLFELEFIKDESLVATQAAFCAFPELDVWRTNDLFSQHPTIPDLWKYEMRLDDLIVLSNGEKFNPMAAEERLTQHPWISTAHITGGGRFQAAVIIYPGDEALAAADPLEIMSSIWPIIEGVNGSLPAFAHLHRGFVRIVTTPFPRTPKGTLARADTERFFAQEIAEMYAMPANYGSHFEIDGTSQVAIMSDLKEAIRLVSSIVNLREDDDLFTRGLDSLHVLRLERLLKTAATGKPWHVTSQMIYSNPSVVQLGNTIWSQIQQGRASAHQDNISSSEATRQMLSKYIKPFKCGRQVAEPFETGSPGGDHLVITGTTGYIGAYLLEALSKSHGVSRIWCLNRSANAKARQLNVSRARGLSTQQWDGKVTFIQWDPSSETLGLTPGVVYELKNQATVILHNAWEVNFNLPLSSFEPQISAISRLVGICQASRHKIRFFLTSSVGTAMNWPSETLGPVPEGELSHFDAPLNGYSASKLVVEHLLGIASQSGALRLSVLRIGQAAGPIKMLGKGGAWNRREWVPALIDASAYLGILPSDLGSATTLDWVPVDYLADIVGEIIMSQMPREHDDTVYYNVLNPSLSSWTEVLPTIKKRLEKARSSRMDVVSFQKWIDLLTDTGPSIIGASNTESLESAKRAQPGLALAAFFQGLADGGLAPSTKEGGERAGIGNVEWIIKNSLSQSKTLARLAPVSSSWFAAWLDQWGY